MPRCPSITCKRIPSIILYTWFAAALFFGYREYLTYVSKLEKHAHSENINVHFVTEAINKISPFLDGPILVILPPDLPGHERWFFHYRIRYKLYPLKVDFAQVAWGGELRKISYDHRLYKGELPVGVNPSNLLPINTADYKYIFTIAPARAYLPNFTVIAKDMNGVVYKRSQ